MPGFKSYSAATFQFIQGLATNIDPASKTVTLSTAGAKVEQAYDVLVIATGSRYEQGAPWKLSPDGIEATKATLRAVQDKVKNASSILLGGAGPTGVEAACELGYEFGKTKEISIVRS